MPNSKSISALNIVLSFYKMQTYINLSMILITSIKIKLNFIDHSIYNDQEKNVSD